MRQLSHTFRSRQMSKITQRTKNQLTDVALAQGWEDSQAFREEATAYTQEFLKRFGIFVGFYNRINNTSMSVEDALHDLDIVSLFSSTVKVVKTPNSNTTTVIKQAQPKKSKRAKSTKRLSYEAFQTDFGSSVDHLVYQGMKSTGNPVTRSEIAQTYKLRIQTVCGVVNRLEEAGLVICVGRVIDEDTKRPVELMQAR